MPVRSLAKYPVKIEELSKTLNKPSKIIKQSVKLDNARSPSNYRTESRAKSPNRKSIVSNVKTLLKNKFKDDDSEKMEVSKSKDKMRIRKEEKSTKKARKVNKDTNDKRNSSINRNGRIILNLPTEQRPNDSQLRSNCICKLKVCECEVGIVNLTLETKKKKDLEKEIKELKKKLKKYKLNKEEKPTMQSHNIIKNKIICINTNYSSKDKGKKDNGCKGTVHTEMLDSRKKSVTSVKTPNVVRDISLRRKTKIKAENPKLSMIHSKNKNSLKDLFQQYNKLKNPSASGNEGLNKEKLKKLKVKIADMYKVVDEKLKVIKDEKPKKMIIDKKLFRKRNNAAITIQRFVRGYLVRKFIWNLLFNPNPTLNTVEDIQSPDTQVTVVSDYNSVRSKSTPRKKTAKKTAISIDKHDNPQNLNKKSNSSVKAIKKQISQNSHAIQTDSIVKFIPINESPLSNFIHDEYKNWSKLDTIISQINNVMKNNRNNTQTFEDLFSQIKEITTQNVTKLKNADANTSNQNTLLKRSSYQKSLFKIDNKLLQKDERSKQGSSSSFQKTYSKTEMDIWPIYQKSSKELIIPIKEPKYRSNDEDKFFYTDRNIKNSSKVLSNYGETISRDISKISMEERSPLQALKKTSKTKILSEFADMNNPSMKLLANDYSYILVQNNQDDTLKKSIALQNIKEEHDLGVLSHHNKIDNSKDQFPTKFNNESKKIEVIENTRELNNCPSDLELLEVSFDYLVKSLKLNDTGTSDLVLDYMVEDILQEPLWLDIISKGAEVKLDLVDDEEAIYGIRTNINAVCEYFNMLIKFIADKHLDDVSSRLIKLKLDNTEIFNSSVSPAHPNTSKTPLHDNNRNRKMWEQKSDPSLILSEKIYLELEAQILDNYKDMNIMEVLFEMQRVYHRCIFDAFNEVLTGVLFNHKNYGLNSSELKVINKDIHCESELLFILHRAKMILLEYTMYLVGLIRDKEDSMMGMSLKNFDIESINLIREEKLFNMISKEYKEIHNCKEMKHKFKSESELLHKRVVSDIEDMLFMELIQDFMN